MNKNLLKSILVGVVFATSLFSFIPGVASAAKSHSGNYVEIPFTVTRKAPTMKNNVPCNSADALNKCIDVASGIGMYHYVGSTHFPEAANIGNNGKITATNTKTGVVSYVTDYEITTDSTYGSKAFIRVYGLPSGTYTMSFSYIDANSSDIKSVISQTQYYCSGPGAGEILSGGQGNDPSKAKGFSIAKYLVDGCKRYNNEPFLPAAQTVLVNGNQAFDFNAGGMTPTIVSASTVAAPEPEIKENAKQGEVADTCPLGPEAPLRWIGCPLIELGGSTADALQGQIKNFLYTPTEQIFGNEGFMQIAGTFRNLGIALIVIAGLVMVISQASGLDFVDAYTVRKLLPRMAIALIGVVLAMPILQFVVTFFNDIGVWTNDLIMATVHPSLPGTHTGGGTDIMQLGIVGGAAMAGIAIFGLGGILSLLGTIILALLVGFLVLAIRQMVVLVTVLLAPLAIAAYVLPGTQKLWEFWKGAFITAMTIFPIIMLFIASGKALSFVLGGSDSSELSLLAILVYFAPFFLLPFAFKLAGGLMSTIFSIANDPARGGFDRLKNIRKGSQEKRMGYYKQRYGDRILQQRAQAVRGLNASASSRGRVAGGMMRFAGRRIAGLGGIESKMSAINARTSKEIGDQIATGNDDDIRGLTVDRSMGWNSAVSQGLARTDKGVRQWKSLGGRWVNESDVIAGQQKWGHDVAAQQAALAYEMRKANSEEEVQGIARRYATTARNQWGMTDTQAGGSWIGASFENQNQHLEYKNTDWKTGNLKTNDLGIKGTGLVDEIYEKRGSYNVAQMGSNTPLALQQAYQSADLVLAGRDENGNAVNYSSEQIASARDNKQKIEAITETFMNQMTGAGGGMTEEQVAEAVGAGGRPGARMANTPGAAHTAERVRQLAQMTGIYRQAPAGQYTSPQARGSADNPREQN